MSYLTYLAADRPLEPVPEPEDLMIVVENGKSRIEPESWFSVCPFAPAEMDSVFTEKPYAAELRWEGGAEQQAALLRDYLSRQAVDETELWKIWMCGLSRPVVRTRAISLAALDAAELERIEGYDPFTDTVGGGDLYDPDTLAVQRRLVIRK